MKDEEKRITALPETGKLVRAHFRLHPSAFILAS
jgi:hypothetical protein